MALVVNDRVRETTTTTGTGTLTLAGAVTGFQTFSSAIGNGNTTYYAISSVSGSEWETGLGTVSAGALARTTVIHSSNSNAAVNLSAGTKDVYCTVPSTKAVFLDSSGNFTFPGDLSISGSFNPQAASWNAPTMLNGWSGQVYSWKSPFNLVHVYSTQLIRTSSPAYVCQLTSGHRPGSYMRFIGHSADISGNIIPTYGSIDTSGNLFLDNLTGYQNYTHFNITFSPSF